MLIQGSSGNYFQKDCIFYLFFIYLYIFRMKMRDIKKWRLVDDVSPLFDANNKRISKIYRNKFVNTENKHILWGVLVFRIVKYFYPLLVFWLRLTGSSKYGTTRKNTQRYYTPKRLVRYLLSNCFFFLLSLSTRLLKQFFLLYKITNCPNNRTISQDICTLFERYLYSTLCSWINKREYKRD